MVVFLYYSGHGCINKGDTHIIAKDDMDLSKLINLDSFIRKFTTYSNVVLVAIIDADRT